MCPFALLLGAALLGGGGTAVWDGSFDFGGEALYWSTLSSEPNSFGWGMRIRSSYVTPGGGCFMSVSGLIYRDDYASLDSRMGHWLTENTAVYFGSRYAVLRGTKALGPQVGLAWKGMTLQGQVGLTTLIGKRISPGLDGRLFAHIEQCWRRLRIGGKVGVSLEHYWHLFPERLGFAGPFAAFEIGF